MTALAPGHTFYRSLATRGAATELPDHLADVITACRAAGYDLVIVETPGIGQGDAAIVMGEGIARFRFQDALELKESVVTVPAP